MGEPATSTSDEMSLFCNARWLRCAISRRIRADFAEIGAGGAAVAAGFFVATLATALPATRAVVGCVLAAVDEGPFDVVALRITLLAADGLPAGELTACSAFTERLDVIEAAAVGLALAATLDPAGGLGLADIFEGEDVLAAAGALTGEAFATDAFAAGAFAATARAGFAVFESAVSLPGLVIRDDLPVAGLPAVEAITREDEWLLAAALVVAAWLLDGGAADLTLDLTPGLALNFAVGLVTAVLALTTLLAAAAVLVLVLVLPEVAAVGAAFFDNGAAGPFAGGMAADLPLAAALDVAVSGLLAAVFLAAEANGLAFAEDFDF